MIIFVGLNKILSDWFFKVGSRYVNIEWEKPIYDGGSPIMGYNVEKRELPNGKWLKVNFGNISNTYFKVDGLSENSKYEFRVLAKNAVGKIPHNSL